MALRISSLWRRRAPNAQAFARARSQPSSVRRHFRKPIQHLSIRVQGVPRTGQRSKNPSLLPNTTVLFYGRILATGVSVVESSYVDYVENDVIAGFVSSADADSYAIIPIDHEGIVFNLFDDPISGSHARIPGLFTMIGGPACGPDALVSIIQHYNWSKVVLYFQNARNVVILSEAFVSIALLGGIEFDLQKRESAGAGAAEADLNDLQAAKSNIFVFFGGLLAL